MLAIKKCSFDWLNAKNFWNKIYVKKVEDTKSQSEADPDCDFISSIFLGWYTPVNVISPHGMAACLIGCTEVWTARLRFRCSHGASDERESLLTYILLDVHILSSY